MPYSAEGDLLEALSEPALITKVDGTICHANGAARRLFGADARDLLVLADDPMRLQAYLRQAAQSRAPILGASRLQLGETLLQARFSCGRIRRDDPVLLIRLLPPEAEQSAVLADRIRALNEEIGYRRRIQATLEEALRDREMLLRELQHRVKNNMQTILSMLGATRRRGPDWDWDAFIDTLNRRLMAMATVQQLMYQSSRLDTIPAGDFLTALTRSIAHSFNVRCELSVVVEVEDIPSEIAFTIALITNELLSNAFKYGLRNGEGQVRVELVRQDHGYRLRVQDDGPGFPPQGEERRDSGLGLVRGLCRQIGGSLHTETREGACCSIRFPVPEPAVSSPGLS